MDRSNATNVASLERKALQNLYISKHSNSKSREGAVPRVEFSSSVFKWYMFSTNFSLCELFSTFFSLFNITLFNFPVFLAYKTQFCYLVLILQEIFLTDVFLGEMTFMTWKFLFCVWCSIAMLAWSFNLIQNKIGYKYVNTFPSWYAYYKNIVKA